MKKFSILFASLCLSATSLAFAANAKTTAKRPPLEPCPAYNSNACPDYGSDNCPGYVPNPEKDRYSKMTPEERWKAKIAHRTQRLHERLSLTAAQEKDWKAYTDSLEQLAPSEKNRPLPPEEFEKLTAPERMEKMLEHMKIHQAQMESHLEAVKKFYGVLNADQKKIFDAEMPRGPRAPRPPKP